MKNYSMKERIKSVKEVKEGEIQTEKKCQVRRMKRRVKRRKRR